MLDTRIALLIVAAFVVGMVVGFFIQALLIVARQCEDEDRWWQ